MDVYEMLFEKDIYIWGTGKRGIKISQVLDYFNIPIKGYIDNDSSKHGNFLGKKCTGLSELVGKQNILVVISPVETRGICEQLDEVNIPYVLGKDIYRDYYFMPPKKESSDYCSVKPFNFYESPYADLREIHDREAEIFDHSKKVLDVDFNIKRQLTLLETMRKTPIIPWDMGKTEKYRYYYNNYMYPRGSADVLYYMMNIIKPKRIIEVGSGFSTAVMLDTNNNCFNNKIKIVSIEPYADRLKSLLRDNDNLEIYECNLQMIPLDFFNQLEKNDILFIDSSHVSKHNSDVNYYLFEIFPRLPKGVYIHIHDMLYPFFYPKSWVYEGRAYNELYLIRAFLMNNNSYSIQFFGDMIMHQFPDKLDKKIKDLSGSLWLRKDR